MSNVLGIEEFVQRRIRNAGGLKDGLSTKNSIEMEGGRLRHDSFGSWLREVNHQICAKK